MFVISVYTRHQKIFILIKILPRRFYLNVVNGNKLFFHKVLMEYKMAKNIGSTCSGFKAWRCTQVTSGDGGLFVLDSWGGKEARHSRSLQL